MSWGGTFRSQAGHFGLRRSEFEIEFRIPITSERRRASRKLNRRRGNPVSEQLERKLQSLKTVLVVVLLLRREMHAGLLLRRETI